MTNCHRLFNEGGAESNSITSKEQRTKTGAWEGETEITHTRTQNITIGS